MSEQTTETTIAYYDKNAWKFADETVSVDLHEIQNRFLSCLYPGSHILDFGCGIGRDTKYFLDHGFDVTATDGSEEMCALASEFTGIPVQLMLFQDLKDQEKYDGVWACASILHLSHEDLQNVMGRISASLKPGGYVYASFKYGKFSGERNGRYFSDFTEETFQEFITCMPELVLIKQWITDDARPDRKEEKWLNNILQKQVRN